MQVHAEMRPMMCVVSGSSPAGVCLCVVWVGAVMLLDEVWEDDEWEEGEDGEETRTENSGGDEP